MTNDQTEEHPSSVACVYVTTIEYDYEGHVAPSGAYRNLAEAQAHFGNSSGEWKQKNERTWMQDEWVSHEGTVFSWNVVTMLDVDERAEGAEDRLVH